MVKSVQKAKNKAQKAKNKALQRNIIKRCIIVLIIIIGRNVQGEEK
jgi:hypothetical protein